MPATIRIQRTPIITTTLVVYSAWEPSALFTGGHSTVTTFDDAEGWWGRIGTDRLPAEIDAIPVGPTRSAAVHEFHRARYDRAYAAIHLSERIREIQREEGRAKPQDTEPKALVPEGAPAREELIANRDLTTAAELLTPVDERFGISLRQAARACEKALQASKGYDGNPVLLEVVNGMARTLRALREAMRSTEADPLSAFGDAPDQP